MGLWVRDLKQKGRGDEGDAARMESCCPPFEIRGLFYGVGCGFGLAEWWRTTHD